MNTDRQYADFAIGDTFVQQRTFSEQDFRLFKKLSGDENPLHDNSEYAKESSFGQKIVPMHLVTAPLSAVAGMVFPGHRSLYLSHDVKSHNAVPFDLELHYSSKVVDTNDAEKILGLRTIVFSGCTVFVSAYQRIKVRDEVFTPALLAQVPPAPELISARERSILVTGAAGEIGRCIAHRLARKGNNLLLVFRKMDRRSRELISLAESFGVRVDALEMDLSEQEKQPLDDFLMDYNGSVEAVVHAACPPISAGLDDLMEVNFSALKRITESLLPFWLARQDGKIIYLSSSAVHYHPLEMEDYVAAKVATSNYVDGVGRRFSGWGITTHSMAVGKVDTAFSGGLEVSRAGQLLPEQVAEEITNVFIDSSPICPYSWLENSGLRQGSYDFIEAKGASERTLNETLRASNPSDAMESSSTAVNEGSLEKDLKSLLADFFSMSLNSDWENAGIDLTSGWDSLRHIELLMTLEKRFGVTFTSIEMAKTSTFLSLLTLLQKKTG